MEYGYGPGSFHIHCERAVEAGARLVVIESKNIALDLDLPEDLEALGGLKKLGLE
jgi:2-phospho-L-lactate guanylyltransferase (CobY/MobA/RfbA family)